MYRKTHTYDPEKVVVTINGVYITGFSDKGKIEIERNEDSRGVKVGVDGGVHYSINNNISGKAKLTIMTTSPSLNYMRELERTQTEFTLSIADMNDVSQNVACDNCVILKRPKTAVDKDVEEQEIEIFIPFFD
jgi:hypothetical protein